MIGERLQVSRHESEIGRWELVSRPAAPALRRHVLGYCGYEEATAGFTCRRELPSGEVVLIVGFGPELRMRYPDLAGGGEVAHRSFVAGLHDTHCVVETPGTQSGVQINLTPVGAHLLLGVPMRELTNRVIGLGEVLGGELLAEALHDAPDWEARFDLLDEVLGRRLDAAAGRESPDVAWAWSRLARTGGRLRVAELCAELGCSRKHIARRFGEQVGVSPKTYARLLRFQGAVQLLGHRDGAHWTVAGGAGRDHSWGEIALECGYFDQAHMNRDFRQFAGLSPGALAASLLPDGGGLVA